MLLYDWHDTRVRTAPTPDGPWRRASVLSPDHFGLMAGKRLSDGKRHLLFGWIPRKACDCGERIWGGHLACPRELTVDRNGVPHSRFFRELDRLFPRRYATLDTSRIRASAGVWHREALGFTAGAEDGSAFGCMTDCPADYRLTFTMRLTGSFATAIWLLRVQLSEYRDPFVEVSDEGYALLFDKAAGLLRLRDHYQWDQRPDLAVCVQDGSLRVSDGVMWVREAARPEND